MQFRKTSTGYGVIDLQSYSYTGNRLKSVDDAVSGRYMAYSGAFDFKDGAHEEDEYAYDSCGALTQDRNKGICMVDYDYGGNPVRVQFRNGNVTEYVYSSGGTKLRTIHRKAMPGLTVPFGERHTLTSAETLSVDSTTHIGNLDIDMYTNCKYYFDGGYLSLGNTASGTYHFMVSDRQGNVRAVVGEDGSLEQEDNYFAYGGLLNDVTTGADLQTHKYGGKELDRMHGLDLYDFGARWYDSNLGLFTSIDPMCEKYYNLNPYLYCGGNPIKYVDPSGDSIVIDNRGYTTHYDESDKDLRVFMNDKCIGSVGSYIDANGWFGNLLADNAKEAKDIWNPFTFREYVQEFGKWDYKYRSPTNKEVKKGSMRKHIIGIAFYRKDKESNRGIGDLPETFFIFGDNPKARAEDLNNFHFGVVGKAYNVFPEFALLRIAGYVEMNKWKEDYEDGIRKTSHVPEKWHPGIINWPYGDNPTDSRWIMRGFDYCKTHF